MDHLPPLGPPPPVPPLPEPEIAPELPYVPWRAREGILVVILAFVSSLFLSIVAFAIFDVRTGEEEDATFVLLAAIISEAMFGVWVWLWVRLRHQRGLDSLGVRRLPGNLKAGLLAGLAGLVASYLASLFLFQIVDQLVRGPVEAPDQLPEVVTGIEVAMSALLVVVAAPIGEELLFRGFLYQAFKRWKGVAKGTVLSAVVFGLVHTDFAGLAEGIRDLQAARILSSLLIVVPTLLLGIVLAHVFERRGSLVPSIVAHGFYNLVGLLFILAAQ